MQEYKDEYKQIQELRKLWSQAIMDWMRIIVPLGTALFGFFSYIGYLDELRGRPFVWVLPIVGWIIFVAVMVTWRVAVYHMDKQIVRMYPRMLELEQRLKWVTHVSYYYYNLHKRARRFLAQNLNMKDIDPNKVSYRKYEAIKKDKDPYSLLLEVWDKYQHKSVTSRGHGVQNGVVIAIIVAAAGLAGFLAWRLWN